MQTVIEKAKILVDALPYIKRFRGETVVVKFGGSIMDDEEAIRSILRDISSMAVLGLRPVIVHGGGKNISKAMTDAGIEPNFVHGLRVTDERTIDVVERILNHEVNPHLVDTLKNLDCNARGMHGEDFISVDKHQGTDPVSGETLDWGYVGNVIDVDAQPIQAFLDAGITPVITPLGRGPDRHIHNVNADEAAAGIARHLRARKLVFLSDVPGLMKDPSDPSTLISHLSKDDVARLVKDGVIAGGMIPKISGAIKALEAGVNKTHIIDASLKHSLLLELFTDEGVGTEIVRGES